MLTYLWKCTVLHCNHLGNTCKPLVLMTDTLIIARALASMIFLVHECLRYIRTFNCSDWKCSTYGARIQGFVRYITQINSCSCFSNSLTFTVLVMTIDALQHFETGQWQRSARGINLWKLIRPPHVSHTESFLWSIRVPIIFCYSFFSLGLDFCKFTVTYHAHTKKTWGKCYSFSGV